jgi:hypothetical protein
MVTAEELLVHIGRRPFEPFRITLVSGETVDVTRTAQAVAMARRVAVATSDHFRWIWLDKIDNVQTLNQPQQSEGGGA